VELWTVLVPILLADVLNPVLFGALLVPFLLVAIGAFIPIDAAWYAMRAEPLVAAWPMHPASQLRSQPVNAVLFHKPFLTYQLETRYPRREGRSAWPTSTTPQQGFLSATT
jgi:hypothetical protein